MRETGSGSEFPAVLSFRLWHLEPGLHFRYWPDDAKALVFVPTTNETHLIGEVEGIILKGLAAASARPGELAELVANTLNVPLDTSLQSDIDATLGELQQRQIARFEIA